MKLAGEIGSGILVTALFVALCTVAPIGAAIAVAVPLMALLAIAAVGDFRDSAEEVRHFGKNGDG